MLEWLRDSGFAASQRKLVLFASSCHRHVWDWMHDAFGRNAAAVLEQFVDGHASGEDVKAVTHAMFDLTDINGKGVIVVAAAACWDGTEQLDWHDFIRYPSWVPERKEQASLLRDVFGNPFRPVTLDPAWLTATVKSLAQAIYTDPAFDRMPILADALEDAGCTNADILSHCRQPGEHCRGCWVLDLLLGKE